MLILQNSYSFSGTLIGVKHIFYGVLSIFLLTFKYPSCNCLVETTIKSRRRQSMNKCLIPSFFPPPFRFLPSYFSLLRGKDGFCLCQSPSSGHVENQQCWLYPYLKNYTFQTVLTQKPKLEELQLYSNIGHFKHRQIASWVPYFRYSFLVISPPLFLICWTSSMFLSLPRYPMASSEY